MKRVFSFPPPLIVLTLFFSMGIFLGSCKKQSIEYKPLASLKIVNAITGGQTIRIGSRTTTVANNANADFGLTPGATNLYIWPTTDSLKPYYNNSVTAGDREIYSLFLGGTHAAVDAVVIKENIPYRADSTFGLRFINLSPGSPEMKVTLSTSATVSEFGNIAYKGYSDFKAYPAGINNKTYTFQVKNATTDALIASVTISDPASGTFNPATGIPRYKNVTLVLRGLVGGTPAAGLTRINHF